MRIIDAFASVAGRISTGSAMGVAFAPGLWNGHQGDIDPVRLGAVVTATVAWLTAEVASGCNPSGHDIALFKRIVELLPDSTTDFIRHHDFGQTFLTGSIRQGYPRLGLGRDTVSVPRPKPKKAMGRGYVQLNAFNAALVSGTGPVRGWMTNPRSGHGGSAAARAAVSLSPGRDTSAKSL